MDQQPLGGAADVHRLRQAGTALTDDQQVGMTGQCDAWVLLDGEMDDVVEARLGERCPRIVGMPLMGLRSCGGDLDDLGNDGADHLQPPRRPGMTVDPHPGQIGRGRTVVSENKGAAHVSSVMAGTILHQGTWSRYGRDSADTEGAEMSESEDRTAIADVIVRYATAIDRRDWELFRTCFTADCGSDYGSIGGWSDIDGLTEFMTTAHANMGHTMHRMTNNVVTFDGDTATGRTYVHVILQIDRNNPG